MAESRSLIVAFRLLLLLLAATAAVVAVRIAVKGRHAGDATARYACPMHPDVRAAAPGECPICRMALEPLATKNRLDLPGMADMAAVENVRKHNIVDFVRRRSLLPVLQELRGAAEVQGDGTIEAVFYRDQADAMAPDERGSFALAETPNVRLVVHRTGDPPALWDRSTSRVRFRVDPAGRGEQGRPWPQPGQVGWLEVAPRPRQVLAVAASAILQSDEGPYVLAWTGRGFSFEKRPVEIGETFLRQGFAVVLSGLRANDRVVSRATFFVEADRRQGGRSAEMSWSNDP